MPIYRVRVTQLVERLSDPADREDLILDEHRKGASKVFKISAENVDQALDELHATVPMSRPEEFRVEIIGKSKEETDASTRP